MENGDFVGVFSQAKQNPDLGSSPSGLWQAWKMFDGDYCVQAIDADFEACGKIFPIKNEDFSDCFVRYEQQNRDCAITHTCTIPADDPNLLDFWFQKKREAVQAGENTEDPQQPEEKPSYTVDPTFFLETAKAPSVNASPIVAANLPESVIEQTMVAAGHAAETGTLQVDTAALAGKIAQDTVGETAALANEPKTREDVRLEQVENTMRTKFKELLDQLQKGDTYAVEKIRKLLEEGTQLSWRQKYMFSEFGLALRREKYLNLALECHKRALACAPNDEHVLFNIARTEYELGNATVARQYLEKALDVLPQFTAAQNFLHFLNTH